MINKAFFLIFLWGVCLVNAQEVKVSALDNGGAGLTSYNGLTSYDHSTVFLEVQNSQGNPMQDWYLSFRVDGNISNGYKNFPPYKLKYQYSYLVANGPNEDNIYPTADNIGLVKTPIPFLNANSYWVYNSPYNLQIKYYFSIKFFYHLFIEGGAYLKDYVSYYNYRVNLIIEVRNRKGEIKATAPYSYWMQILPTDNLPVEPKYGMQLNASAKNVWLEFKSANDYANGVSKSYPNALSTYSSTPYEVRVNALSNNLTSASNKILPINTVKLMIKENATQRTMGEVYLSSAQQKLFSNTEHAGNKFFDAIYSTKPGDTNFFDKDYEQYSETVFFTMIPQ